MEGRSWIGTEFSDPTAMKTFHPFIFPAALLAGFLPVTPVSAAQKSSGKKSAPKKSTAVLAAKKSTDGPAAKKSAPGAPVVEMPESEPGIAEGPEHAAEQNADLLLAAEMMKQLEAAGMPGPQHHRLEPLLGEWSAEIKIWVTPGGTPSVSQGVARAQWAMGGRFVQEDFHGEMWGKPFSVMRLIGYDNLKQRYTAMSVDDLGTAITASEGTADQVGKVLQFSGHQDCPLTGEKDIPVKQVLRILTRDLHVFEMHDLRRGENSKTMEVTYSRK
jgi:hypothetical protein